MTVLPHVGGTHRPNTETRRLMTTEGEARRVAAVRASAAARRNFNDHDVLAAWTMGESQRKIADRLGISKRGVQLAIERAMSGSARRPIPCPAPAVPPPLRPNSGGDASTGGLRGAPAETNGHPGGWTGVGTGDNVGSTTQAGAPIVRRQLDEHGDTLYVFDLPAARYRTHSYSLVLEMLQPFEPSSVRWINEED